MVHKFRTQIIAAVLTLTTLLVYWQVWGHAFLNYDDNLYVTERALIQRGLTLDGLRWAFSTIELNSWQPLTWLSHMLDSQIYGNRAGGHHFTSVLMHIVSALVLFWVLSRMTGAIGRSGLVAALFSLHPLHVESVAWIAERKDVLSALFWMLTLWAYLNYIERPQFKRYGLVLLFFSFGLMSKPMVVTLPFVLLLIDYWPLKRIHFARTSLLPILREKIPFIVLAGAASGVSFYAQRFAGSLATFEGLPFGMRLLNAIHSYAAYIWKTVWPMELAVFYPYYGGINPWLLVGSLVTLMLVSYWTIRVFRNNPAPAIGWLWYLGTLVPVIGLVQIGSQAMADRYTYIPHIGLFLLVVWSVPDRLAKKSVTPIAAILLALMILTARQTGYWKNSVSLFEHALRVTRNNYIAHTNLGVGLAEAGTPQESEKHYRAALQIKPDHADALHNLGVVLAAQGQLDEAIRLYEKALLLEPKSSKIYNNLAVALKRQGKLDRALTQYERALQLKPDFSEAHYNFAVALLASGNTDGALRHYSAAVLNAPNYAKAHAGLGILLGEQGRAAEAADHLKKALALNPALAVARLHLVRAYRALGSQMQAQDELEILQKQNPRMAEEFVTK